MSPNIICLLFKKAWHQSSICTMFRFSHFRWPWPWKKKRNEVEKYRMYVMTSKRKSWNVHVSCRHNVHHDFRKQVITSTICDNVKKKKIFHNVESMSWRQVIRHDLKVCKICADRRQQIWKVRLNVKGYIDDSWCQKVPHNVKRYVITSTSTSWCQEVRHDVTNCGSTVLMSKGHHIKKYGNYIMISKSTTRCQKMA